MSLKSVVTDITTVPEALREEYEERDGKFVLLVEDFDSHPNVHGLKSAFGKTKDEFARLKSQYKDVDPARYQELVAKEKEMADAAAGNDPEKIRSRVAGEFQKKLEEEQGNTNKYRNMFHGVAKTDRVKTAALTSGVIPDDIADVVALTEKYFELDETSMKVLVKDEEGNPTGETLEQFFSQTFKSKKPKFYVSTMGSGSGSTGSGSGSAGSSGVVRISTDQAKDVGLYRRARAEAEKRGVQVVIEG